MVLRRTLGTLAAVHLAGSLVVSGQTATLDGVQALLRGDTETAARILRPRAEDLRHPDALAQFYMASLYETGRGVMRDEMRACALYERAMEAHGTWALKDERGLQFLLSDVAHDKAAAFMQWMSEAQFHECQTLAVLGFDHGFESMTFAIEREHSVDLDVSGATITYRGKQTWTDWPIAWSPGSHVLAVEHTVLSTGQPRTPQHFIEISAWFPDRDWQAWTLIWHVFEVVGNELMPVTRQELLTIVASTPPGNSVDIHQLATIHVDQNGDPEWVVGTGSTRRSEGMETPESRQVQATYRAREAADSRVDWSRVGDVQRAPTLSYIDADGCGNFMVYGWSADRMELITLRAERDSLRLSANPQTFALGRPLTALELVVHVFDRPQREWLVCTDVGTGPQVKETWSAIGGLVTIELSPPRIHSSMPVTYRAEIRIVGAEFVNAKGVRIRQIQPITLSAAVGGVLG